jgi:cell wall-associated NlpC family hydrolase
MLRKFIPAPVIFFIVLGLITGAGFQKTAMARTTSMLTTPALTGKNNTGTEQSNRKSQIVTKSNKSEKEATIKKGSAKKKTLITKHAVKKKQAAHSPKKKAQIAKKATKNTHSKKHVIAGSKGHKHKKAGLARHPGKSSKHRLAKRSRVKKVVEPITTTEQTPVDPVVDLWLAKDAPERFREGTNDHELNELTLKILESAISYLGTPYRYGGTTPNGFDCSGFVRHVFSENGISLGRSSRDQALEGKRISLYDLKPGDLLFFNMRRRKQHHIDHVGLYIGKGQFIHASSNHSREIAIENLDTERYLPKIVEARRVLDTIQ